MKRQTDRSKQILRKKLLKGQLSTEGLYIRGSYNQLPLEKVLKAVVRFEEKIKKGITLLDLEERRLC